MKHRILTLAILAIPLHASAQALIDAPTPKSDLHVHKLDIGLDIADAVSHAIDAKETIRLANSPCGCYPESDPFAPHGSQALPIVTFAMGVSAAAITIEYFAEKSHHRWVRVAGRGLLSLDIGDEVNTDIHSFAAPTIPKIY